MEVTLSIVQEEGSIVTRQAQSVVADVHIKAAGVQEGGDSDESPSGQLIRHAIAAAVGNEEREDELNRVMDVVASVEGYRALEFHAPTSDEMINHTVAAVLKKWCVKFLTFCHQTLRWQNFATNPSNQVIFLFMVFFCSGA